MASEITMPQLSDTMTEGTIVKWHKKEGDKVKAGEEIADIETDKATMPMESFEGGTLAFIAAKEGQKVKVGDLLAVVAVASEDAAQVKKEAEAKGGAPARPAAAVAQHHGSTPKDVEADHPEYRAQANHEREQVTAVHASARSVAVAEPPARGGNGRDRVRVSPLAKRIAMDKGIDLARVAGSGPNGRIVERDVMALVEEQPAAPAPVAPQSKPAVPAEAPKPALAPIVGTGQKQVIAMTKMRTAIATALQRSKQLVPHFYETIDVDLEEVMRLRERLNQKLEKENVRLSVADFIYKAVAGALVRHPALNARFNADKGEITRYGDVNLGIAVSIPDGLIVPVLRNIHQLGLRDIRVRSLDLAERARVQRLKREEQSEGTFTVTSLGSQGIREFSAIINPPEVGILAVGAAEKRAVVRDGQIVARTMITLTLSADHRVVDGAVAADFMLTLRNLLEEPGMLLV